MIKILVSLFLRLTVKLILIELNIIVFERYKLRKESMSGWEDYVNQIINKMNYDTNEYDVTNMCASAAIYGFDGTLWASAGDWKGVSSYEFDLEDMTGNIQKVPVDEFQCLMKAADGDRKPTEAGIRFGGNKYMFITHNAEAKSTQMSRSNPSGGATVAKTNTAIIVATWNKTDVMSNKLTQSGGDTAGQVEGMAAYLAEQGY